MVTASPTTPPPASLEELHEQITGSFVWDPTNSRKSTAHSNFLKQNLKELAKRYAIDLTAAPVHSDPKREAHYLILNSSDNPLQGKHVRFDPKGIHFIKGADDDAIVAALFHIKKDTNRWHNSFSMDSKDPLFKLRSWAHAQEMGITVKGYSPPFHLSAFEQKIVDDIKKYHADRLTHAQNNSNAGAGIATGTGTPTGTTAPGRPPATGAPGFATGTAPVPAP